MSRETFYMMRLPQTRELSNMVCRDEARMDFKLRAFSVDENGVVGRDLQSGDLAANCAECILLAKRELDEAFPVELMLRLSEDFVIEDELFPEGARMRLYCRTKWRGGAVAFG